MLVYTNDFFSPVATFKFFLEEVVKLKIAIQLSFSHWCVLCAN